MYRGIPDEVKEEAARMLEKGGMTQREIAEKLGISPSSVSKINQDWFSSSDSSVSEVGPFSTSSGPIYSPVMTHQISIAPDNSQQLRTELTAQRNTIKRLHKKMDVLSQKIKKKDITIKELLTANKSHSNVNQYEEIKKRNEELKKSNEKLSEKNKELTKENQKLCDACDRMEKKLDYKAEQLKTLLGKLLELCAKYD